jgi:2-keto-3-deoxy-galactonokinase
MTKSFIGFDWGTTSFRAYLAGSNGQVGGQRTKPEGIFAVRCGAFEDSLEVSIDGWDKLLPIIASSCPSSDKLELFAA